MYILIMLILKLKYLDLSSVKRRLHQKGRLSQGGFYPFGGK